MNSVVVERARAIENPQRAVLATDPDGVVIYWGPGAVRLYGWSEKEALGRNILELTPSEMSRSDAQGIMQMLTRGRSWSGVFQVQTKNGSRFDVDVTDIPVRSASGELIGIIGSSQRVTE